MRARLFTYSLVAAALAGGTALATDVLSVSDEEALASLVDDLVESPDDAMLHWIDPSLAPVEVQVDGERGELSTALSRFEGDEVEVVQRSVEREGDRANVAVRARVDGRLADARFRLERHGERWLVHRVVAR